MIDHIAFIMDGNRRFAKKNDKEVAWGHKQGGLALKRVLLWCKKRNIKDVTVYAFSKENFKRSEEEKNNLMKLFLEMFDFEKKENNYLKEINNSFNINIIGDISQFPKIVKEKLKLIEKKEKNNEFNLNLCLGYDGRSEIVYSVNQIIKKGLEINEKNILENLWLNKEPDLIIRTAENRLSGFLLYQSSYSEIIFLENLLWPEIDEIVLEKCYNNFETRNRKFGK